MNRWLAGLGLCLVLVCNSTVWSDEDTDAKSADRRKVAGRLPTNYSKLGVTDTQREKIYSLQDKYQDQLEELTQKIIELKTERDKEIQSVLTPAQKARLKEIEEEAKKPKKADDKK